MTTLYAAPGSYSDNGGIPNSLVEGGDGNFYGTTTADSENGTTFGTVFVLTPAGVLTTLYSFHRRRYGRRDSLAVGWFRAATATSTAPPPAVIRQAAAAAL